MNRPEIKELQKYCLTSRKKFYFISVIAYIFLEIICTAVLMMPDEDSDGFDEPVAAVISAVVLLIIWIIAHCHYITTPRKRFKGRLKYFEEKGVLDYAISDVRQGVKKFDGRVLLGQYCIMGKGTGLIVFYNEINAMYVKITINSDEDGTTESWDLKIDAGGKTYDICSVKKNEKSIRDWADICTFLRLKAPNIQIK